MSDGEECLRGEPVKEAVKRVAQSTASPTAGSDNRVAFPPWLLLAHVKSLVGACRLSPGKVSCPGPLPLSSAGKKRPSL